MTNINMLVCFSLHTDILDMVILGLESNSGAPQLLNEFVTLPLATGKKQTWMNEWKQTWVNKNKQTWMNKQQTNMYEWKTNMNEWKQTNMNEKNKQT